MPDSQTDPISALENADERVRRDLAKAVRFCASQLEGDDLRSFVRELTALLRRFVPAEECQADSTEG